MIKIEDVNTNCRQNRKPGVHVIKPQQFSKGFFFFFKVFPSLPAESDEKSRSNRQMLNHINVYLITSLPLSVSSSLFNTTFVGTSIKLSVDLCLTL